ncbi:MAG: ATP-binding cassette domain-containing protein [Pirellulaceae bacterium]|nr:ATP-binding cassette domain-containing protein [Pirellulaceae bacterium]
MVNELTNDWSGIARLRNATVRYSSASGQESIGLSDVTLQICERDFLTVVGKSGSGKSTLLRLLAGLHQCDAGEISFAKNKKRLKTALLFQENVLFPWMTVEQNLVYPLSVRRASRQEQQKTAYQSCLDVGLSPEAYLHRYPRELSGGEKRRVALGMAVNHDADLLLLDEPSSGLDDVNKWRFQGFLETLWRNSRVTIVMVTHDIEEAAFLGSRVVCMDEGRVAEVVEIGIERPRTFQDRFGNTLIELKKRIANALISGGT